MKKSILLLLFFVQGMALHSQIIQTEATTGFSKSGISHFSSFPASVKAGIHLKTLAFFQKHHRPQEAFLDEAGFQLSVLKQLSSSFSAGPALYYNSFAGLMEKLSISYLKSGSSFSLGFTPSAGFSHKEGSLFSEVYFQIRYRKSLSTKWQLIGALQALSNWTNSPGETKSSFHSRSFQYLRIGLSNKYNWQFGWALDFDQYGPDPIQKATPGIFLSKTIIHH